MSIENQQGLKIRVTILSYLGLSEYTQYSRRSCLWKKWMLLKLILFFSRQQKIRTENLTKNKNDCQRKHIKKWKKQWLHGSFDLLGSECWLNRINAGGLTKWITT